MNVLVEKSTVDSDVKNIFNWPIKFYCRARGDKCNFFVLQLLP